MRLAEPKGPRLPLSMRLTAALLVLVASFASVLLFYVVPRTTSAFLERGDTLLQEGSVTMRELAELQTIGIRTVLTDLIEHNADVRRRALQDLPLELLDGDVHKIRETIAAEDAQRSARQKDNVQMLSREMIRRADRRIDSDLAELAARQHAATMVFAQDLRQTQFVLIGSSLGVLLLVLGFGLHRYVVRPTLRLNRATQRVAGGDLAVDLPPPSNDELGDLARAFASMVVQLRDSRSELQRLAANLEHEVQRKTRHLEQTLAELRDSHQQLAQAERLAALGTLAGGIAHEFHNVIGGIRGCASELLAEETVDDRRETLGVIQRAADRATGIVQQLLRFPAARSRSRGTSISPPWPPMPCASANLPRAGKGSRSSGCCPRAPSCAAMPTACIRCSSTWSPIRCRPCLQAAHSPFASPRTQGVLRLRSPIRASALRPPTCHTCSNRSSRPARRPRITRAAAPASASPFRTGS